MDREDRIYSWALRAMGRDGGPTRLAKVSGLFRPARIGERRPVDPCASGPFVIIASDAPIALPRPQDARSSD